MTEEDLIKKENNKGREYHQVTQESSQKINGTFNNAGGLRVDKEGFSAISEHPFHVFIEKMDEPALILSKEGKILYANRIFFSFLGYSQEEVIGHSILKFVQEDYKTYLLTLLHNQEKTKSEFCFIAKNQKELTFTLSIFKGVWDSSESCCVLMSDITKFKRSQLHTGVSETIGDWIWEIDKAGNFTFSNQAVYKLLDYEIEELLGKNIFYYFFVDDRDVMEKQLKENVVQKKGWTQKTMRFRHRNGSERWFDTNASELLNAEHELLGFRGVSRDITEIRNLEKIKNEFISMVSHELRTPLTSILGALTLVMQRNLTPEEKNELLSAAQRNSNHLSNIINDIMDVEKFQLGQIKFDFKKVNLRDVVLESIESSDVIRRKFDVKITMEDDFSAAEVKGDSLRLIQVMINLLSNAIKFSPPKSIVKVAIVDEGMIVRVSVTDRGPGIMEEFRPKIFEKFAQADSSSKRAYQGTGLGLSICKSIIEGHGGSIHYKTKMGEGTTFFFELPKFIEN